ncbi:MAG: diacylglycerol kinase family protein [Oscillospiraceae bacterium]
MKMIKSFKYALCGLLYCIKNERNFRIHIVAAVTVAIFAWFYGILPSQVPPLIIAILGVMILEIINTSIETTIDLITKKFSPLAKIAKDVAAGAVLLAALGAIGVAIFTFWDIQKLMRVFEIFKSPLLIILAILYAITCLLFIFFIFKEGRFNKREG